MPPETFDDLIVGAGLAGVFASNRLLLTDQFETEIDNLFACGDGSGVTRGLIQVSTAGLIAARAVLSRLL